MSLKVLQLAPLWFPVSPDAPGGIETYLPTLIGAIQELGCEMTLMGCPGSSTTAELIEVVDRNLWDAMEDGQAWEYAPYEQHQLALVLEAARHFDVVHSHVGFGAYVLSSIPDVGERVLHTQHNPVTPDLEWYIRRHPELPLTAVSEFQAAKLRASGATSCQVIPNGLDVSKFPFQPRPGRGLAFLGRMEAEKGPDVAVRVARELGAELTLAGPMTDGAFFAAEVEPWLDERIRYVGVVGHEDKTRLLGDASVVLMPSRWEEPFGLVAVEAMMCGTPVIALARGALPQLIEPAAGGFLAEGEGDLAPLVQRALELDRAGVRASAQERFDIRRVAPRYVELYEAIVAGTVVGTGAP